MINIILNPNVTEDQLRAYGFTDHVPEHWYYVCRLHGTISFNLTIDKESSYFKIEVLDEDFLQHYDFEYIRYRGNNSYADKIYQLYKNKIIELLNNNILEVTT